MNTVTTYSKALINYFVSEDNRETIVSISLGIVTSVTTAGFLKVLTDLLMAFGVGLMGAGGGLVAKTLWDYFKKRSRRWF